VRPAAHRPGDDDAVGAPEVTAGKSRARAPAPGRRLAAAVALLALTAAALIVVAALVRDPARLVGGLLMLFVAVVAGWTALVRRGAWRWVGLACAVVALVVFGWLLATGSLARLAALVVLIVLAIAAGRVALGDDLVERSDHQPVKPARRGVLFLNPRSGGGKAERFGLAELARRQGITPVVLHPGDDLRALAEQAVADGADVLGMAGGDGSQALVADVARQHDVPLVVVPAGTRNHFALDLGLDRDDVAAALDAFTTAVERRIDLAVVNDRIFVNNASLGVYATIVQSEEYRDAKVGTAARMAPELVGPDAEAPHLRYLDEHGDPARPATVLLVSNGAYRLEGLTGFGTRARLDGGNLGIVAVAIERATDVPTLLAAQATGQLHNFHGYREWTAPTFEVDSDRPLVDIGIDGEALRLSPPLRFRSLPGALRIRTPAGAGSSPAARAPAGPGRAVAGVARVLVGRPAD
jgi:diacylglycerol kinase family enzyme